ncbi:MAG: hypothetical protein IMZ64_02350 [Bacteroidetes bacterium]|nr:hypothetical protein [Bacteroidota bacterium]
MPKKFIRYYSIEKLMASLLQIPESKAGDYSVGYDGGELSNVDFKKAIEHQGVWGFIDDKKVVHYWMKKSAPLDTLITFIAHETGHLNGRTYKNQRKEEEKAHSYDQIALYAYQEALKMKG